MNIGGAFKFEVSLDVCPELGWSVLFEGDRGKGQKIIAYIGYLELIVYFVNTS